MKVRIGDICTLKSGTSLKEDVLDVNEGIPYVKVSDMNLAGNEKYIVRANSYANENINPKMLFPVGTILFPKRGGAIGTNKKRIADKVVCADLNTMGVIPSEKIRPLFLYYYFQNIDFGILYNGSSVPQINNTDIAPMEIELLSLKEQDDAINIFERVDSIINGRKRELEMLDNLIKARFVEMFGDPVSNSYGLPEATLPELGEFGRGVSKHRPRNDPKLLGGEYPLIQTGDVAAANLYITSYNSTYSELGLKQSKMWSKGTLCITIAANIAKTAILDFDACFPDSVVGFTANEKTNNVFIHYWFSFFQSILESQAPESAQKNINLKILSELKVIVPEKAKQDEFVEFIKQVDKSKVIEINASWRFIYSLMPRLMAA